MAVRESFLQELQVLEGDLLNMGNVVSEMLEKAIVALKERDVELAEKVINMDDEVDDYNLNIENKCLQLIALQQPMAKDLRIIAAALKIITDIERCGDYIVDIAKTAKVLSEKELFKPLIDIPKMAKLVEDMLKDALTGFVEKDINLIQKMIDEDDEVDHLYKSLYDEIISYVEKDPSLTKQAVHLLMICRCLERIADHITNVGERVYYMETGELKELHQ
jgi:phosphate transport system protein